VGVKRTWRDCLELKGHSFFLEMFALFIIMRRSLKDMVLMALQIIYSAPVHLGAATSLAHQPNLQSYGMDCPRYSALRLKFFIVIVA
jgi:hypothetical protein